MEANSSFTLSNGVKIPAIGFGTWKIPNGEATYDAVSYALKTGYRHIDTAHAYGNEESVGKAVRHSGINRNDIFITSKLPASIKSYNETLSSFDKTMKNLALDYLDLYLIHAPAPWDKRWEDYSRLNIEVWKAMEEIYKSGRCRAIGVSNFKISDLVPILEHCEIKPMANQIRFYIGNTQEKILNFCLKNNIIVEGYSPLASGTIVNNNKIALVAEKYHTTVPKICMRYVLQRGVIPVTKSVNPDRIVQNKDIDFVISEEDMKYLDKLKNTVGEGFGVQLIKKVYHAVCAKVYYKKH